MKELLETTPAVILAGAIAICAIMLALSHVFDSARNSAYTRFQKEAVFLGYGVGKGEEFQWIHRNSSAAKWFDETNKGE
jgi:hypothetical protein